MVQLGWRLHLSMALMMMMVDYAAPIHFAFFLCCCCCFFFFFRFHFYYFVMKRQGRPSKCVGAHLHDAISLLGVCDVRGEGSISTTVAADANERQCTIYSLLFFSCLIKPNTFRANAHTRACDDGRVWNRWVAVCLAFANAF